MLLPMKAREEAVLTTYILVAKKNSSHERKTRKRRPHLGFQCASLKHQGFCCCERERGGDFGNSLSFILVDKSYYQIVDFRNVLPQVRSL